MRPPATCAACGQTFLRREPIAILGSRIYHKACRRMVERGLANPITEPTPNEDHWRKQVIELEQRLHRMNQACERGVAAITAAENHLREMREQRTLLLRDRAQLEVERREAVMALTESRQRNWIDARACRAVGRGIWGLARYVAVHEYPGVDYTAERYRLMELD